MSIFEYDEEKHMKSERKEWREIGRKEGLKAGFDIIKSLMDAGKYEEAKRALSDNDYREQLCQIIFQKASNSNKLTSNPYCYATREPDETAESCTLVCSLLTSMRARFSNLILYYFPIPS